METGERVDVLPDRTADTLAAWLREHPGTERVCRDRGGRMPRPYGRPHRTPSRWQTASISGRTCARRWRSASCSTTPANPSRPAITSRTRQRLSRRRRPPLRLFPPSGKACGSPCGGNGTRPCTTCWPRRGDLRDRPSARPGAPDRAPLRPRRHPRGHDTRPRTASTVISAMITSSWAAGLGGAPEAVVGEARPTPRRVLSVAQPACHAANRGALRRGPLAM